MKALEPNRGIWQGDPLSLYLYVICMKRLAHLIDYEVRLGNWKPISVSRDVPKVFSLAFADDLILFCEASTYQAQVMISCLDRFSRAPGSKVSL